MIINGRGYSAPLKRAQSCVAGLRKPPVTAGWNRTINLLPTIFNKSYLRLQSHTVTSPIALTSIADGDNMPQYGIYGTGGSNNLTIPFYDGDTDGVIYIKIRRLGDFIAEQQSTIITPYIPFYYNPSGTTQTNSAYIACVTPVNTLGDVSLSDLTENYSNGEYDDYYIVTSATLYNGAIPRSELKLNNQPTNVFPTTQYTWQTIQTNQTTVTGQGSYLIQNSIILSTLSNYRDDVPSAPTSAFQDTDYITVEQLPNEQGVFIGNGTEINTPYKTLLIGQYNEDYTRGIRIGNVKVSCDFRYNTTMFRSLEWNRSNVAYIACAFKTIDDIISYYNDWGFIATTNLSDAINLPGTDINPDYVPPGIPEIPQDVNSFPDNSSDQVEFPSVNISAATLAGCLVYNYLNALDVLKWLKSNTFYEDINRLFSNPLDAVYSFILYPFDFLNHDSDHLTSQPTTSILNVSTDIANYLINDGYNFIIEGGEYTCVPYYGNFADYAYIDYSLYIPFYGIIPLNPDDVVNHTLSVKYALDISSGGCSIFILSDGQLLRIVTGSLGQSIPITSSNNNERILNLTLSIFGAVGGVGQGIAESAVTQNPLPAIGSVVNGVKDIGATAVKNPYRQCINGKLGIDTAIYAPYDCYLILDNHYYSPPSAQKDLMGIPSNLATTLNDLTGYFSLKSVNFTSATATESEINEIVSLLQSGVYRS